MKTNLLTLASLAIGLAAPLPLLAQCCGGGASTMQGCSMPGMDRIPAAAHAADEASSTAANHALAKPVFAEPVQSIFDNYIKVQTALVHDSLDGVADAGAAITKALPSAASEKLPAALTGQAESLAKAKDLDSARDAFKLLSNSLVEFAKSHNATGTYHIAYCPMAKASWLQTGTTVMNPYFGKAMLHCGQLKS